MRPKEQQHQRRLLRSLGALVLLAGAARGEEVKVANDDATYPPLTAPQLRYFKMDAEAEQVSDRSGSGGSSSQSQRLYFAPGIGIGWDYYLYHPNLLTFQLLAEPGYSWQQIKTDGRSSSQDSLLLNGSLNAVVLPQKPYSASVNYSRTRGEYHYDFFNSATVDTVAYGAATGYREGAVPFTVTYQHTLTDSAGFSNTSTVEQSMVTFQAQNERARGNSTDLSYQLSLYKGNYFNDASSFDASEATHNLTLTDSEHLTDRLDLNSTLSYNRYESQGTASDNPMVMLNLNWQLAPRLRNFYDASVSDYSSGDSSTVNRSARAGIQHQLYESLTSTLDVHGSDSSNDGFGSQSKTESAGSTLTEGYNKRLGDWGTLSLNNTASYDVTQQGGSGGIITIVDESHTVTPTGLLATPLNSPRVVFISSVTYLDGITPVPLAATDYNVLAVGELTQIQLTPSGQGKLAAAVPPATAIRVGYTAQANPNGTYTTFNNETEIRLGFWQQQASVYLRYNFSDNQTDTAGFVLDNFQELQAGADLNWQKLRLNAVGTDRHSSLYGYQSLTLSEGYTFFQTVRNSAGLDFHQQWNAFNNSGGAGTTTDLAYYSFTARYEWHLSTRFSWRNEAGYEMQRGSGADRNYLVGRSYVSCFIGKLDLNFGYEYENQKYTAETRERNFVFLRMRRNF